MKICEAIAKADELKSNTYSFADKVKWLSILDSMVKRTVIDTHEGGDGVSFTPYDDNTDTSTELLIPEPYDDAYLHWLEAKIDYHNGEYGKYNNATDAFNAVWNAFKNDYNRTHMPKGVGMTFF